MRKTWRMGVCAVLLGAASWSATALAADEAAQSCGPDEELDGGKCFPKCIGDGYTRYEGDGDECWQICPSNSQDYGNVCLMGPAQLKKKMFKRGPGRALTG